MRPNSGITATLNTKIETWYMKMGPGKLSRGIITEFCARITHHGTTFR
jgi:hypothetical protein